MIDQDIFDQAVEAARARFSEGVWERLPVGQKAEAIHAELRRIDPETVKGVIPINSGPTRRASRRNQAISKPVSSGWLSGVNRHAKRTPYWSAPLRVDRIKRQI